MNLTSHIHAASCLVRRDLAGLFCVLVLLSLLTFSPSAIAASQMHVRDNGAGVYEVKAVRSAADSTAEQRDVTLSTGDKAVLSVDFPNGMDWQLGEQSRLMLEFFTYFGPFMDVEPVRIQWKRGELKDLVVASEKAASSWAARLDRGELYISALRPRDGSIHLITTREARFNLHSSAVMIRRSDEGGTVINVYNGSATITTSSGQVFDAEQGTKIVINPKGEISRSAIQSGEWAWSPPARGTAVAAFPRVSIDVTLVSPSS